MKTDLYTKAVLTVIAVALTVIAFRHPDFFPAANAGGSFPGFAAVPVSPDGSVRVKFEETMKVNVAEIGGTAVYGPLPVNVKEVGGNGINPIYGIPMNLEAIDGSSIFEAVPVKMKN